MRFRSLTLLATLLAAGLPAAAQEPITEPIALTLPDALRRALDANLGLESTRAEIAVSDAQRRAILGAILPKINITGNVTENTEEVAFGSDGDERTILPATDWGYRLTFSQPIYAGNRERKTLQQAKLGTETARQDVSATADRVLLNVAADYLGVVQGEELLAVEQRNLELARRRREQAQIFFDAGETTRVDVLRAETAIKAAERRLATARQVREAAASRLRVSLAVGDTTAPVRVTAPGQLFPTLPPEQALLTEAETLRPEVMRARTAVDIAKLEVGKQRGALLPVVTADGGWINQKSTFPSDQYGFVALRFTVPLYQGGEVAARTVQARERQRQAELPAGGGPPGRARGGAPGDARSRDRRGQPAAHPRAAHRRRGRVRAGQRALPRAGADLARGRVRRGVPRRGPPRGHDRQAGPRPRRAAGLGGRRPTQVNSSSGGRPMTRFSSVLLSVALLAALGCGGAKEEAAPADASAQAAPPLPSDVQGVAAVSTPAPAAAGAQPTVTESLAETGPEAAPRIVDGTVSATGELVSPVISEVAVRSPGRVGKVFADEGDRVRRGQPLLTLETEYLSLDLKRAEAEVARARAAAGESERDFRRKEELVAKDSVSKAAYDRSQSNHQAALASVAAAEADRDLARQKLADAVLRSPITGVVAERRADAGERLGDQSVAFVVAQTAPLKLRFRLPERYLSELRRGQSVRATVDPYPGETFSGRVTLVGGVVDPTTRTVAVETEFANSDGRLSPGLFARVEIDLGGQAAAGQG